MEHDQLRRRFANEASAIQLEFDHIKKRTEAELFKLKNHDLIGKLLLEKLSASSIPAGMSSIQPMAVVVPAASPKPSPTTSPKPVINVMGEGSGSSLVPPLSLSPNANDVSRLPMKSLGVFTDSPITLQLTPRGGSRPRENSHSFVSDGVTLSLYVLITYHYNHS